MTAGTVARHGGDFRPGGTEFWQLLHAEWTKFRTVRGWVIAMVIAALATAGVALLDHSSCGGAVSPGSPPVAGLGCSSPVGPGGEAVTDSFYFVRQPLDGNGSITARLTGMTSQPAAGLQPWAKAGIIIKSSTRPGSAYAAMLVTGGHGVRMQYDFTGDIAGPPGRVSASAPRWLRLTRSGDTITGYQSADGISWQRVGTVQLAGLPGTVQAGLFAATTAAVQSRSQSLTGSSSGAAVTLATAHFDHVGLEPRRPASGWAGVSVGGGPAGGSPSAVGTRAQEGFQQAGGTFTVTGSGDIAPDVPAAPDGNGYPVERTLLGAFAGLVAVIVVAVMFMTAEYRRGLIRVTLAASPRRGRVLAAKAVVVGTVSFAAGLAGAAAAVAAGEHLLRSHGNFVLPVSTLTEIRIVAGTAALPAVAAIFVLAIGALLRSSAGAVTAGLVLIVLPYLLVNAVAAFPADAADWMLRLTPAAAFAIQQSLPQYPQVSASYTPANGYYPLAPWAGFAVLCGYAALALVLAMVRLRRADA